MLKLNRSLFPERPSNFISISVVPVLYRPILGSPEQFVIGILCFSAGGCHLERANRLEKLACLYGDNSTGVLLAIALGLDVLEAAIRSPDFSAADFKSAVSGMYLGELNLTENSSLEAAARIWLSAQCSLFAPN
jgi:hypothetical protein